MSQESTLLRREISTLQRDNESMLERLDSLEGARGEVILRLESLEKYQKENLEQVFVNEGGFWIPAEERKKRVTRPEEPFGRSDGWTSSPSANAARNRIATLEETVAQLEETERGLHAEIASAARDTARDQDEIDRHQLEVVVKDTRIGDLEREVHGLKEALQITSDGQNAACLSAQRYLDNMSRQATRIEQLEAELWVAKQDLDTHQSDIKAQTARIRELEKQVKDLEEVCDDLERKPLDEQDAEYFQNRIVFLTRELDEARRTRDASQEDIKHLRAAYSEYSKRMNETKHTLLCIINEAE